MLGFFSKIFEGFINVLAIILLIVGAIFGAAIIGGSEGSVLLGIVVGVLVTFVYEIIFFGVIAQIISMKNLLEKQNTILQDMANKA